MTSVRAESPRAAPGRGPKLVFRSVSMRNVGAVIALAVAYYAAAKVGQALRYTASVSAMWPPVGVGIAAIYLWGIRWWPGIFLGELLINAELTNNGIPLGSIVGQQIGNMAEVILGALLLQRLVGPRVKLDRVDQVIRMLIALGAATAVSATVGTISMVAGGVVAAEDVHTFWRTWWLGDTTGALVVLPLALAWATAPRAAWRRLGTLEGGYLVVAVVALTTAAVASSAPLTYMIFPALVWAALRFGLPGATGAVALVAALTLGITAHEVGPFSSQPIDERTLSTQLYVFVAALTTLFVSAVVSEREGSVRALAAAHRSEDERTLAERHRIARDLHDSVSQALFTMGLQTRTAQKALARSGPPGRTAPVARALRAIAELTRSAQNEMRSLIFELGHDPIQGGVVAALAKHGARLRDDGALAAVVVEGGKTIPALDPQVEMQLFSIGREALANVVRHAGATSTRVSIDAHDGRVVLAVRDNGRGFDPGRIRPGHFGLESMRSRAAEIGATFTVTSAVGRGTVVRVEGPIVTAGDD